MAFVRRRGNSYYLVHNKRQRGKVRQLQLARLGERPRITDDVVREVSRQHPFLDLDWNLLRQQVNSRVELFDPKSDYVNELLQTLRQLHLDLAELSPPLLRWSRAPQVGQDIVMHLRLLRSTLDVKLNQFEQAGRGLTLDTRSYR
jgi:hypothetical protein